MEHSLCEYFFYRAAKGGDLVGGGPAEGGQLQDKKSIFSILIMLC